MRKHTESLQKAENVIMMVTFSVMVVAFFLQVVNRNFLKFSMPWLEELAVFSMIYMIMLGTEAGLRDGSQISVSVLVDWLTGKAKLILRLFIKVVVVSFSLLVFLSSFELVQRQITAGQTSPALRLPMAVPYLGITIPFGIITVVQSILLVGLLRDLVQGRTDSTDDAARHFTEEELTT